MHKLWITKPQNRTLSENLAKEMGISAVMAQFLLNRGVTDPAAADNFLKCRKSSLHDPFMLKDMEKAVVRVKGAIDKNEPILIYGDYDVDGITGVAVLVTFLKRQGAEVSFYVPNRLDEGYGMNMKAVKDIEKKKIGLLISIDCGITDKEEVEYLMGRGIDVIVIDHHRVQKDLLPGAYAVIDPMQDGCDYPFKHLSAVGLAYKFVCAFRNDRAHENDDFLDLVALGTVADVSPQIGENRILTRYGLKKIADTDNIGIKALMQVAGVNTKEITTTHVGFMLGPRINASGRIGTPEMALRMLLSNNREEARELAEVLNEENKYRQKLQEKILSQAMDQVERVDFKQNKVLVVWGDDWHPGVVGIVASKIVNRFYRPSIVLSVKGGIGKGSGRSIDGFHLFNAVSECREVLGEFGGHEAACGVTVASNNLDRFSSMVNRVADDMLDVKDLIPKVRIDMEVSLQDVTLDLLREMELLEPYGPENPKTLLLTKNLKLKNLPAGFGKNGVKFWATDDFATCEAKHFNRQELSSPVEGLDRFDLVYSPQIRRSFGIESVELSVEDLKTA
ncbi:MAG: single-stranded-DNA-specific exonuclease RecJ [Candidatus Omnitrophota bacterium]